MLKMVKNAPQEFKIFVDGKMVMSSAIEKAARHYYNMAVGCYGKISLVVLKQNDTILKKSK